MPGTAVGLPAGSLFRTSSRDVLLVLAAGAQGLLLATTAASFDARISWLWVPVLVAASVWWGSNTISHIHLHSPVFRSRQANRAFSLYLTAALGVPQSIWRARHLHHHAGAARAAHKPGLPRGALAELILVAAVWAAMLWLRPAFFAFAWLPGYVVAMLLCQAQGAWEHAGGVEDGISFYGPLYNRLWFNDGYHAEHHRAPDAHWTHLPSLRASDAPVSELPPIVRWLGVGAKLRLRALELLERIALGSPSLQRFMVETHRRAFARLLPLVEGERPNGKIGRVCIVGGGLFPRTAIALRPLLPNAELLLLDRSAEHLARAREFLRLAAINDERIVFVERELRWDEVGEFDLIVLPLAFDGNSADAYTRAGRRVPMVVVHDWLWNRRGRVGVVISPLLLKRLNLA